MAGGVLRPGEEVMILPSRKTTRVSEIVTYDGNLEEAFPPQSVTVTLEEELDISRGDMIVYPHNQPNVGRHFEAMVVWMDDNPLNTQGQYLLKHTTQTTKCLVSELRYKVDINTLNKDKVDHLAMNEIGRLVFMTHQPIFFDTYQKNRHTGSFILIDPITNRTAAAGMIIDREPVDQLPAKMATDRESTRSRRKHQSQVPIPDRQTRLGQKAVTLWLTGQVSSGKSEVAYELEMQLHRRGAHATVLHGGTLREGLSRELNFSPADIAEHLRRTAETARLMNEAGLIVICSLVSPSADLRRQAREIIGPDRFVEVHVDAPQQWCRERDETGLYALADKGDVKNLAGVNTRYEVPANPDIRLSVAELGFAEAATQLLHLLAEQGHYPLNT